MKVYKVSELVVGIVYKCRLSGIHMLIEQIPEKVTQTMQGEVVTKWRIGAVYFNPVTGLYTHMVPVDNQLIELE